MRRTATMTSKGQVTVPVEVRRRLGLKQGDRVAFEVADGTATLRPVPAEPDAFTRYAGVLSALADEAAVAAWLRDLRGDDE
jgi:antitoxin PrlF